MISQTAYIQQILRRFEMNEGNHTKVKTPANLQEMLNSSMSPANYKEREEMKDVPYREAVGAFMFACTVDWTSFTRRAKRHNSSQILVQRIGWGVKRNFRYLREQQI